MELSDAKFAPGKPGLIPQEPVTAKPHGRSKQERAKTTGSSSSSSRGHNAAGLATRGRDMKSSGSHSGSSPHPSPRWGRKIAKHDAAQAKKAASKKPGKDDDSKTVELLKRPGQSLGFYIREGNGYDQHSGVFVTRVAPGSIIECNNLIHVGDEILAINAVDVTRMSLDDVVILMSIPKRLKIKLKRRQYGTGSKNSSCPSLNNIQPAEEPPVVVLKNRCRANSSSAVEMTEHGDELGGLAGSHTDYNNLIDHTVYGAGGLRNTEGIKPLYLSHAKSAHYEAQHTPDDSGDSGLSSENSGCSAAGAPPVGATVTSYNPTTPQQQRDGAMSHFLLERTPTPNERLGNVLDLKQYEIDPRYLQHQPQQPQQKRGSPRDTMTSVSFHSPLVTRRNPYAQMEFGSESHGRISHMRSASDVPGFRTPTRGGNVYDPAAIKAFQEEIERTHYRYETGQQQQQQQQQQASMLYAKIRSLSPDRYNSDTEMPPQRMRELAQPEMKSYAHLSHLLQVDDRCNSLPQIDLSRASKDDIQSWLAKKYDALSLEQKMAAQGATHTMPRRQPVQAGKC